jgi:hypothetical protein
VKSRSWCETRFRAFFIPQKNENAPKTHSSLRHYQSTTRATVKTSKSEEGVARWLSFTVFAVSHIGGSVVAPFWSEWQVSHVQKCHPSAVRKCVSQGTSPGTFRDKIQHYRSRVDRYKILECEGVNTLFYSKLNNINLNSENVPR